MQWMIAFTLLLAGCSTTKTGPTSTEAKQELNDKFGPKIGSATKEDFIEEFGNAEWCLPKDSGEETCRFYRKKGTKWLGDKKNRTHFDSYDQIIAEFDEKGILRAIKSSAQR